MNLAWVSLAALLVAIVLSCVTQLNVGILGLAFAWVVGVYVAHMKLDDVLAGRLPRTVAEFAPSLADRLTVVPGDALRVTELPVPPTALVANLPYNVAVPVVLHLLSEFPTLRHGLVMVQAEVADRLTVIGQERVFVLHRHTDDEDPADSVYLSQRDVRELQFAKASIATGWHILCRDMGIEPEGIAQVLLGGSFGSYLTPASAVKIGLVPNIALTRIVAAGNTAGEGAKIAALSVTERAAAHAVLDEVQYVELSGRADFNDLFIDQLAFPA